VLGADGKVLAAPVYDGMLSPSIYSGMGVGDVMARMVGGGALVERIIVVMLILAVVLSIMTAMAGSSGRCTRRRSTAGCRATCRT